MFKRFIPILLLIIASCVEPYKIDLPEGERLLTIDGIITNEPGPHSIRLTRSDTYGSVFEGLIRPVTQATLVIRDEDGLSTFLKEGTQGFYRTPEGFRAEVGKTYSLQIELLDGTRYASLPEKVLPVVPLDDVSYRAIQSPTENRLLEKVGVQLTAQFKDPGDQNNHYYWRLLQSTYMLKTNPELFTNSPNHPTNPRGPAPKDCCATCYVRETIPSNFQVRSDESFNGLSTLETVAYIEDDGKRFRDTYRADVQQLSISAAAYRFLKLVQQQVRISGSVFDQPPATIRGNMVNLSDPDEIVLGYFLVAASSIKRVYIRNEALEFKAVPAVIPDDCQVVPGAVTEPPLDWNR